MTILDEQKAAEWLTIHEDTVLVLVSPGLIDYLRFKRITLRDYFVTERHRLAQEFPGLRFVFGVSLFSALEESSKGEVATSVSDWVADLQDFSSSSDEPRGVMVIAPSLPSLHLARKWASRSISELKIKAHGGKPNSLLPHVVLRTAFLSRAQGNRNVPGTDMRKSDPILNQASWQFLLMSSAMRSAVNGRVFVISRSDLDKSPSPTRVDDFDVLCGDPDVQDAWEYLGLPDYIYSMTSADEITAPANPLGPSTSDGVELEQCPSLSSSGNFALVDANLLSMGRIPDLLAHFDAKDLTCRVLVPVIVQLEVARKVIFGNDTSHDQHLLWALTGPSGQGPNSLLAIALQEQVSLWARALWDAAGPGKFCTISLSSEALDYVSGTVWGGATTGTADLLYAATYVDVDSKSNRHVMAYTDDQSLAKFIGSLSVLGADSQ